MYVVDRWMDFTYKIKVFKTKYLARLVYACIWNSILPETRKAIECKNSTYSTFYILIDLIAILDGFISESILILKVVSSADMVKDLNQGRR